MNGTIFASGFYVIGLLLVCSGFLFYRKTKTPQLIMLWLPLTGILMECLMTFVAGLLCLVHIPTNLVTLGIFPLAFGIFFWYRILKKGERQKFRRFSIYDVVFAVLFVSALMIILAVAIIYMIYRYIRWYKEEIADYISLFVAFSTFAISTTLSEYVKEHLSINLIALNIIIHLVYTGFRHYYRECRKNRGYYYQ